MVSFPIPQKEGIVTAQIITRIKVLEELATELFVMNIVSKLHPDCPISPSGMFCIVCAKHKQIMGIMDIHPLDIIIYMNGL